MKPIVEYEEVRPDLFFWSAYDASVKADLGCCAIVTNTGLVFVDPLPLASEPLEELTARFQPVGIIVTNANHLRGSADFAEQFGIRIFAHEDAIAGGTLRENEPSIGGLKVIELPGFGTGEIALSISNALILGDALINFEPSGLSVLPDKYCNDPRLGRTSLQKLLRCEFGLMTFAHGPPLVQHARDRLHALLI